MPELTQLQRKAESARVLILTGASGSGKTTVSELLAWDRGWVRVCEDDIWVQRFGNNRGALCSDEQRENRRQVHETVVRVCRSAMARRWSVVIDATVHEAPPEAFEEYQALFRRHDIPWVLRVLHPPAEVAIERDGARGPWHVGAAGVLDVHRKFTGAVFGSDVFLDNSHQTPEETVTMLLRSLEDAEATGTAGG